MTKPSEVVSSHQNHYSQFWIFFRTQKMPILVRIKKRVHKKDWRIVSESLIQFIIN